MPGPDKLGPRVAAGSCNKISRSSWTCVCALSPIYLTGSLHLWVFVGALAGDTQEEIHAGSFPDNLEKSSSILSGRW